jgi:RNA polymerase sigma-70 factor, ECF subfamily
MQPGAVWVFHPRIYRYCRKRMPAGDPEDMAMAIMEKALDRFPSFQPRPGRDPMECLFGWLMRMTRNALIDVHRKHRLALVPLAEYPPDRAPAPDEILDARDRTRMLAGAIRGLGSDKQARVIACRYVAGMTLAQTAAHLDTNTGAVKSLEWRGLERLRETLKNGGMR